MSSSRNGRKAKETAHHEIDDVLPEFFRKALNASHKADLEEKKPIRAYPGTSQMDYADEERIYLMAVDRYKNRTGRVFLTNSEHFALLTKELGYIKGPPKEDD